MTIQEAIKEAHECAKAHGFHSPSPSVPALLALVITELSEAIEADRRNKYFSNPEWKLTHIIYMLKNSEDNYSIETYEYWLKDTFEDELAGACIRIFDLAGLLNIEIWNPPTHLNESDIPGNIMEAMSQIGYAYVSIKGEGLLNIYNKERNPISLKAHLSNTIGIVFAIAKKLDFDLWAHIDAAMKFNRLMEVKHGKKY